MFQLLKMLRQRQVIISVLLLITTTLLGSSSLLEREDIAVGYIEQVAGAPEEYSKCSNCLKCCVRSKSSSLSSRKLRNDP